MDVSDSTIATINALVTPKREDWITEAIASLDTILLDRSLCERKAAGVALNLIFHYPSSTKLVRMLWRDRAGRTRTFRASQSVVRTARNFFCAFVSTSLWCGVESTSTPGTR